jgi:thiamine pyrophosphokinase
MITVAELLSEKQKLKELEKQYKTQKQVRKSYISESDRQEFILLAAIGGKLEEILKNYMQYKKPKPRVTALKYTITYIFKVLEDYFLGMSEQEKQKEVQKILRDLKSGRYEVMLVKKY